MEEVLEKFDVSVLFVEDNETVRFLYEQIISVKVNRFYIAENGKEGLELFKKHFTDLIITDISMPVMDGLEMIKHIKQINPEIKVIVMSAYSIKEYFLKAIDLGVNGYLIKPVETEKLFSLIRELTDTILIKKEIVVKDKKRRQAEENLKRSLKEKEILLKEVHHRVKNNMQIISSILKMQARLIDDIKLKDVLAESQNRIHSMALIHENLYRSENLADIKFLNYVKSLACNLSRSYAEQQRKVRFKFDIEDIYMPIDTGIPCGLILNELISNSLKFAFPKKNVGIIEIKLIKTGEGEFELSVSDNGVGMDKSFDWKKSKSLGLKIVNKLIQQIDGTIESDFSEGTKFIICFKI